jgi:hypothetical protein
METVHTDYSQDWSLTVAKVRGYNQVAVYDTADIYNTLHLSIPETIRLIAALSAALQECTT